MMMMIQFLSSAGGQFILMGLSLALLLCTDFDFEQHI